MDTFEKKVSSLMLLILVIMIVIAVIAPFSTPYGLVFLFTPSVVVGLKVLVGFWSVLVLLVIMLVMLVIA